MAQKILRLFLFYCFILGLLNIAYAGEAESVAGFTIIATPITQGITGTKKLFIDETGSLRFTDDGTEVSKDSKRLDDLMSITK